MTRSFSGDRYDQRPGGDYRPGPGASVPLARPRRRVELTSDRTFLRWRKAVLKFLYERFVEAAE